MIYTTPIPKGAMPAVEMIRRHIPRPDRLPRALIPWERHTLRFGKDCRCPIGLLPESEFRAPSATQAAQLLGIEYSPAAFFIEWWDKQVDPKGAVDALWPMPEKSP